MKKEAKWFKTGESPEVEDWQPGGVEAEDPNTPKDVDFEDSTKSVESDPEPESSDDEASAAAEEPESADEAAEQQQPDIDLEAEREEARQAGYESGYEEGYEDGKTEREELEQTLRSEYEQGLENGVASLTEFEQKILREASDATVTLARVFAEKLIRIQLEQNAETMRELAIESIKRAAGFEEITIFTHPDAVELLENNTTELMRNHPDVSAIEIKADDALAFGDLYIRSPEGGEIQNVIGDRLERLAETARNHLEIDEQTAQTADPETDSTESSSEPPEHDDD